MLAKRAAEPSASQQPAPQPQQATKPQRAPLVVTADPGTAPGSGQPQQQPAAAQHMETGKVSKPSAAKGSRSSPQRSYRDRDRSRETPAHECVRPLERSPARGSDKAARTHERTHSRPARRSSERSPGRSSEYRDLRARDSVRSLSSHRSSERRGSRAHEYVQYSRASPESSRSRSPPAHEYRTLSPGAVRRLAAHRSRESAYSRQPRRSLPAHEYRSSRQSSESPEPAHQYRSFSPSAARKYQHLRVRQEASSSSRSRSRSRDGPAQHRSSKRRRSTPADRAQRSSLSPGLRDAAKLKTESQSAAADARQQPPGQNGSDSRCAPSPSPAHPPALP